MEIENSEDNTNKEVPLSVRWEIVHLKRQGLSGTQVSERVFHSPSTCNSIYNKWKNTRDVVNLPRSGRPLKATPEVQKMIIEEVKENPTFNIDQMIEETGTDISNSTARNVLKNNKYRYKTVKEKWILTEKHRKERVLWAKQHVSKPLEYWKRVVFTDECRIQRNPKKQKLWAPEGMEIPATESDRWQGSIMVWGALTSEKVSLLHIIDGEWKSKNYLDMLKARLLKNLRNLHPKNTGGDEKKRLIFQQDGASIHTTSMIMDYFQKNQIEVVSWPSKSPDLNLIESVWSYLKDKLQRSYDSVEELEEDVLNQWKAIPFWFIENLYNSFPRRIQAVLDAEGGPTKY